jgi:acyl-CoA synthetase (AMP-forming)/AMP-acid ligase II
MSFFEKLDIYDKRTALIDESGSIVTYSRLLRDADTLAEKIGRRCLIFFMCRNCIESVTGYVGFLRNHIIPVLLNDSIPSSLLMNLMEQYRPLFFYLPTECIGKIAGASFYTYGSYTLLKLKYAEDYVLNPELALLLTTSGSTGSPKLVRQSYQNIEANTGSIIEYLDINETDRAVTTLPMSYTYGLSIITTHLCSGASIILTDASLMEQRFWTLLKTRKATTFGGVPYTYEMIKRLRFEKIELPDLRYITQAGGKLSKELADEFIAICKKKNIKFIIMYGQTEATARMSYLPWEFAGEKGGSIGVVIPGGTFLLADEHGNVIDSAEITGELIYKGKNVTLGYAENRYDLERGDDNNGILHTGDMARRDKDGFYYIVGRQKRFLKLFGNRVNLDEVEGILKKEGFDCACVGEDDLLRIYITSRENKERVTSFIYEHTGINRNGFRIFVIDKIPRNEAGKIVYSVLG